MALGSQDNTGIQDWSFLNDLTQDQKQAAASDVTPDQVKSEIAKAAVENNIRPSLLLAQAHQESGGFDPDVINGRRLSSAGAIGAGQIIPGIAKELGIDPYDPIQNAQGQAKYMRQLLDRFNGNEDLALAAYNAGPGAIEKYGGIPPFSETKKYVPKVKALESKYATASISPEQEAAAQGKSPQISDWSFLSDIAPAKVDEPTAATTTKELVQAGTDPGSIIKSADLTFGKTLKYLGKSAISGATFGLIPNELETDSTPLRVSGYAANLIGGLTTFSLAASGLGSLGLIPGAEAAAEAGLAAKKAKSAFNAAKALAAVGEATPEEVAAAKSAAWSARAASIGKNTIKAATEGAIIGAPVGATRGIIQGDDNLTDILADAATESAQFAGFAVVATPILEGAGATVGMKIRGKFGQAQEQAVKNPAFVNVLIDLTSTENLSYKPDPEITIGKIKTINPEMGTKIDYLANPENLKSDFNDRMKQVAEDYFLKPESPGSDLYQSNENIQQLMKDGNYAQAMDAVPSGILKIARGTKDFKDFLGNPFFNDARSLAVAKASQITDQSAKFAGIPGLHDVLVDYGTNVPGAEERLNAITQDVQSKYGNKFAKVFSKKIDQFKADDIKLTGPQINSLVHNTLQTHLQTLANGGIKVNDLGAMGEAEGLINALTTFNKPLTQTIFQAFSNKSIKEDQMINVPKELQSYVDPLIDRQVYLQDLQATNRKLLKYDMANSVDANNSVIGDTRSALAARISYLGRKIDAIDTGLKNTGDEESLAKAREIVNKAYIPSKTSLAPKVMDENGNPLEVSTNNILGRYFPKNNPYLLLKDSDLANQMHALSLSGYNPNKFVSLSPFNLQRKMSREFGQNNPIQVALFDPLKDADAMIDRAKGVYEKQIDSWGIKQGTPLSAMLSDYVEGKLDQSELAKLSQEDRQKIITAAPQVRQIYSDFIDAVNETRSRNNLPLVNKIKGETGEYLHHFQETMNSLPELTKQYLASGGQVDPESFSSSPSALRMYNSDPTRNFWAAELHRSNQEGYVKDAVFGLKKYLGSGLNQIAYTDLIRKTDALKEFAPAGLQDALQDFKMNYLLKAPNSFDSEAVHPLAGKILTAGRSLNAMATILGNVSSIVAKAQTLGSNFMVGGKAGVKAIIMRGSDEAKEVLANSTLLAGRNPETEGFGFDQGIMRKAMEKRGLGGVADTLSIARKVAGAGFKIADRLTTEHGVLSGYYMGRAQGMTPEEATRFGDYIGALTHVEYSRLGQPEFMQSTVGRAFAQFQSFPMNLMASMLHDLPMYANSDGAAKAMSSIMKAYAAITLTNEVLKSNGIAPHFDAYSFMPFMGGLRYNSSKLNAAFSQIPGPIGEGTNLAAIPIAYATDNEKLKKQALEGLPRTLASIVGVPGANQVLKSYAYGTSDQADQDEGMQKVLGYIFGKGVKYVKEDYQREVEKRKNNAFRQKMGGQ